MTLHEGNAANGIRYPRPLRCAACGDEWVHSPPVDEPFHFILEARVGVCDGCWQAGRSYQGEGLASKGVPGVQLSMELE